MNKELTASLEDYLKQIYILKSEGANVRVTDVAEILGISKASVNKAINNLKVKGYVNHEHYGTIEMTEKGEAAAEEILDNYKASYKFFLTVLGVSEEEAKESAHQMEHMLNKVTRKKLKKLVKKQKK